MDANWQYIHDGPKQLACAILFAAIDDWDKYGTINKKRAGAILGRWRYNAAQRRCVLADELGFDSPRAEMLDFFRSDWFQTLCDVAEKPAGAVLKRVGLCFVEPDQTRTL